MNSNIKHLYQNLGETDDKIGNLEFSRLEDDRSRVEHDTSTELASLVQKSEEKVKDLEEKMNEMNLRLEAHQQTVEMKCCAFDMDLIEKLE